MKRHRQFPMNEHQWIFSIGMIMGLLLFSAASLNAQGDQEIAKNRLPDFVKEAIETDFVTCNNKFKWYVYDKEVNRWAAIKSDRKMHGVLPDYFVATARGDNVTCEGVYDKNGRLVRSKVVFKNVELPDFVMEAVTKDYPGWEVGGDEIVIRDFDENKKYFQVLIYKDRDTKTVYYDAKGKKVKRRFTSEP